MSEVAASVLSFNKKSIPSFKLERLAEKSSPNEKAAGISEPDIPVVVIPVVNSRYRRC